MKVDNFLCDVTCKSLNSMSISSSLVVIFVCIAKKSSKYFSFNLILFVFSNKGMYLVIMHFKHCSILPHHWVHI